MQRFADRKAPFLLAWVTRAGVSYDAGHLELNDKQIQTLLFSAGLAIPSPVSGFVCCHQL